jgi:hypothetical protein
VTLSPRGVKRRSDSRPRPPVDNLQREVGPSYPYGGHREAAGASPNGTLSGSRRAEGPGESNLASRKESSAGATLRQIAATLNREGRKPPRTDVWHAGSLGPIVKSMEVAGAC